MLHRHARVARRHCARTAFIAPSLLWAACAQGAFLYDPPIESIEHAYFRIDLAELHAVRTISGFEVNTAKLVDPRANGLGMYDLSDALFGAAPNGSNITLAATQTHVYEVEIDPSFYGALETGRLGLWATFTDTDDGWFGIDFISLVIETQKTSVEVFFGGMTNDGFKINPGPPADNANLSMPFRTLRPEGSSGTGFDEAVSSKSIHVVPAPGAGVLAIVAAGLVARRRRVER